MQDSAKENAMGVDDYQKIIEKYKELYQFAKSIYVERLELVSKIEEKASKYLSVLTFIIATQIAFINDLLNFYLRDLNLINIVCFTLYLLINGFMFLSWFRCLKCIKVETINHININEDMIKIFKENELYNVHLALAKEFTKNKSIATDVSKIKASYLESAYKYLKIGIWLIVVFIFLNLIKTLVD